MDCVKGMRKLPVNSVQVIVTSPPYNMQKRYAGYKDNLKWAEYFGFLRSVFVETYRVLKSNGLLFVNISNSARNQYKAYELAYLLRDIGFLLVDTVIWHKPYPMPHPSKKLLTNAYEHVFVFAKSKKYYFNRNAIKVPCKDSHKLKCKGNVWAFGQVRKNQFSELGHCAMFPEELPRLCILLGSKIDDVVLDPFIGSGTTAVIAKKLGRRYLGFDLSKEYVLMSRKRLMEVGSYEAS